MGQKELDDLWVKVLELVSAEQKVDPKGSSAQIAKLATIDEIDVFLVDGNKVKQEHDFKEGGNDLRYDFIPENQVWIDYELKQGEHKFIAYHELIERKLMSQGMKYEEAHEFSNAQEKIRREQESKVLSSIEIFSVVQDFSGNLN